MHQKLLNKSVLLFLFSWIACLQPDGFAERTLVMGHYGLRPIEQFVVGNAVIVIAAGGALQPYSIMRTMSYVADSFIKIYIKDVCVCAAPQQKFYSCTRNDWVSANALNTSEQLLCGNGNLVCVDRLETVHKKQKMHTFTVETSHIFCVTPYEIIAHNIEPTVTTGVIVGLSVTCPPAAIAVAAAEAVTFGIIGCVMYCAHRKSQKNQRNFNAHFSTNTKSHGLHDHKKTVGCYNPIPDCPIVCDIRAGKETETAKITPYEKPEVINVNCEFPRETIESPILHYTATKQSECDEHKRYNGPWYNRTEDWIKEHPVGQKIKKFLERSIYINQGKRAFYVLKDIEGCTGFKKGDYVVVDALHNDHFEVFGKNLKWKHVANFDGTLNEKKTEQGRTEDRQKLQRG